MQEKQLFEKYLKGECSKEEMDKLFLLLKENPLEYFEDITADLWENIDLREEEDIEYADAYMSMYHKLADHIEKENKPLTASETKSKKIRSLVPYFMKAAAIIIVLLSLVFYFYDGQVEEWGFTSVSTGFAETKNIELPDGSLVILNANSTLKYASQWEKGENREVILFGEAFFSIKKTEDLQKFLVKAKDVHIEVLGTEFNVHNRRDNTKVVLNSGSVMLKVQDQALKMQPGDMAEFSKEENTIKSQLVDPEIYTSWTQNKLVFDGVSFKEMATLLEDNYGLKVTFSSDNIKDWRFSGSTPGNNLNILYESLQKLYPLEIVKGKQKLLFREKDI